MKDLSIEEKAKAYDEAIEVAQRFYNNSVAITKKGLEDIFPELKESEDERIRKALIYHYQGDGCICTNEYRIDYKDIRAWLEKQGEQKKDLCEGCDNVKGCVDCVEGDNWAHYYYENEQKPDKIEPKFKVGNWYQCTKDFFGKGVTFDKNTAYYCEKEGCLKNEYGCHIAIVKDLYDNFKLWTIQDAKDGDVLYSPCLKLLWIFKSRDTVYVYCGCNLNYNDGAFFGEGYFERPTDAIPATKEQRDLLFQKMKEAGYEWDAEKKELRKIGQNPAWSEEDGKMINKLLAVVNLYYDRSGNDLDKQSCISFLKSLKDRVQPKQEWSEEDDKMLNSLISSLARIGASTRTDSTSINYTFSKEIDWLKSLKPQNIWKPSDEQMATFWDAICNLNHDGYKWIDDLKSLFQDLKKLR